LLENNNAKSGVVLDALKESLHGSEIDQSLEALSEHISNYDFEEAVDSLAVLAKSLNIVVEE